MAVAVGVMGGSARGGEAAESRGRVLDLRSYWRSFYVLRPARLSPRLWKTKGGRDPDKLRPRS